MRRLVFGLCGAVLSACFIPVDAGNDRSCLVGSNETCAESAQAGALAGTCRADGVCACNPGYTLSQTGRCVAEVGPTDVMLLVDVSGSMNAVVRSIPGCEGCPQMPCASTCPTRIGTLREGMGSFLQSRTSAARFGVTTFPTPDNNFSPGGCRPTDRIVVPLPSGPDADTVDALTAQTQLVSTFIESLGRTVPIQGGTPTAGSLRFLAGYQPLLTAGRRRGVILVTDGLPNCNPNNSLSCQAPSPAGRCTLNPLPNPMNVNNCSGQYCRAGFLDDTETVAALTALRNAGVRTAIVAIPDTTDAQALATLNAMAAAGGAPACAAGPNCPNQFFEAPNAAALSTALTAALARIEQP
jgi:hypothetical protein